jgi:hypothetical protein
VQQQQTATTWLLAVCLARSVVALADAADPSAVLLVVVPDATAGNGGSSSSADMQQAANGAAAVDDLTSAVYAWQHNVVYIVFTVLTTFTLLGLRIAAQPCSSCYSHSSSGISGRVRWAYLLQLARSKKLAAAADGLVFHCEKLCR